jgi:hypothetical protein
MIKMVSQLQRRCRFMTDRNDGSPEPREVGMAPAGYEAPRVTFDEILEVVAATCTGAGAKFDAGSCPSVGGVFKT